MLRRLLGLGPANVPAIEVDLVPRPVGTAVRLAPRARPVRLQLGEREILLVVEPETDSRKPSSWLLSEPVRDGAVLRGFVRMRPGETLIIGRDDERVQRVFDLPRGVSRRHLELRNDDGGLVLRNLAPDHRCLLSLADEGYGIEHARRHRLSNLDRLRTIIGGGIGLLEPREALEALRQTVATLRDESYRAKDAGGRSGGLLDLPGARIPMILGDLHGRLDNLLRVLCEERCLDALESGSAYLLLLGDTVHREDEHGLEEMESSMLMLDVLCRLKLRFPDSIFWLRGNHESYDEAVGKAGIPQGMLLRKAVRERRGVAYEGALAELFGSLAYIARSDDFIACHAGAPRRALTVHDLVYIRENPELAEELVWVRPRSSGRPAGFTRRDVARLRSALGAAKDTPLIVGHTPMSDDGVLWMNAADIPGVHVIYDSRPAGVPVFTRLRGGLGTLIYRPEPSLGPGNGGDAGSGASTSPD